MCNKLESKNNCNLIMYDNKMKKISETKSENSIIG